MSVFTYSSMDNTPNHYNWRLPKPSAQAKLQPLDMNAMDELFEALGDPQDLEKTKAPALSSTEWPHPPQLF
ncbi:hypothetical protein [Leptolyngbya sp. PCC 6406]|uniref:hypothetical protein n=1 Tax=Leptolyngbya sp. PCC 6406 TaxID=1173264 RepID=UPI0002AC45F0|nr:hypothetical protein [Leptolyngbya sp. PCC 6406]